MTGKAMLAVCLLAGACAPSQRPVAPFPASANPSWRAVATKDDRERLREWRSAFTDAVAAARRAGHAAELEAEGSLLEADSALGDPAIPNGRYNCRVIKLGAKNGGLLDYIAYPAFTCIIGTDGAIQRFDKISGSQRQVGLLYPNDAVSLVFLGTLVLGDETRALRYGQDESRDVAGYVQRVGPRRWRLVMPRPHFESITDVMELVPAN